MSNNYYFDGESGIVTLPFGLFYVRRHPQAAGMQSFGVVGGEKCGLYGINPKR